MTLQYTKKLNPSRRLKVPRAIKAERREVTITHNTSTIAAGHTLNVKLPALGKDYIIVPGTAKLALKLDLDAASDDNRTVYNNMARNLISEIKVNLQGNKLASYRDAEVSIEINS